PPIYPLSLHDALSICTPAVVAKEQGPQLPPDGSERHEGVERADERAGHAHRQADEAASGGPRAGETPAGQRHCLLRLGYHRYLRSEEHTSELQSQSNL